jgi:hypothetical protein
MKNLVVFFSYLLFFLFFQSTSIYGGDAGDLVAAAYTGGIAHPPGYPLYSFLGYILTHIPISTVAWRVGLLSVIPAAGTLTLIYMLLTRFTKDKVIPFIASTTLAATYLFWLYGVVPEVFALLAFFISCLLYAAYSFSQSPSIRKLYALAFVVGLSLAHHHIIIFAIPAIGLLIWQQRGFIQKLSPIHFFKILLWAALGLSPYIWVYISALRNPAVIWDDPISLQNIIRLISRADYGSFQSGTTYGQDIRSRFLQFVALFDFYSADFTLLGMILFVIGAISSLVRRVKVAIPLLIGFLLTGPLYFFYASYLFTSAFHIATAERFLIPSYVFFTVIMGYGMYFLLQRTRSMLHTYYPKLQNIVTLALIGLYVLIPCSLLYSNLPKISILKHDRTAENFGRDILQSVEPHSILLLQGDHPVFNTQYMYYAEGMRNDVSILHMTKFLNGTGYRQIRKYYPDLTIPKTPDTLLAIVPFIKRHYQQYPIYSTVPFELVPEGYRWVPYGLLYRLYKEDDIPAYPRVKAENDRLWQSYQHPLEGSLGQYKNLMLSNITDYYKDASVRRGLYAATHGEDYVGALKYYTYALMLDPHRGSILYLKGDAYMSLNMCDRALDHFKKGFSYRSDDPQLFYESMMAVYKVCYKDQEKATYWTRKRDAFLKQKETKLKGL